MTLRERITDAWTALTGRAAPASSAGNYGWTGGPASADAFGSKRSPTPWKLVEAYKGLVYACANGNATATVRVPLRLYATTGRGMSKPRCAHVGVTPEKRKWLAELPWVARSMSQGDNIDEVTEHPLLKALDKPNSEFEDRQSFLRFLLLSLDIVGTAYVVPNDGGFGPPSELWPLESQWVFPVRQGNSVLVSKYTYFDSNYKSDELIKFKWISLRDPYGPGYSPAQAAWEYSGLEDKWTSVQDQLLGLQARVGVMISPKDGTSGMGDPERAYLETGINRKFGPGGQGRAMVSTVPLAVDPVTYPPIDPGGIALSTYDLQRVANIFCYPIEYLTADTNLANLQAAHRKHAEQAIEPRCHLIASVLTQYAKRFDDRLFFAFDSCLAEDEESEAKVFDIKLKNGSLTINEARAEDGLDPQDWGDEPWLASTLRQPSEERPVPAAPGGKPGDPAKPGADAPKAEAKAKDDGARALDLASRMLALMEREDGPARFPGPDEPALAGPARRLRRGRGGHRGGVDRVVQEAGEGRPDDPFAEHDGHPRELPEPGELRSADGAGDDPDPDGLLGAVGGRHDGAIEGRDGPGPGGVEGGEPPHPEQDRAGEPELLPRDEQDDPVRP